MDQMLSDHGMIDNNISFTPPPGEEAFELSHEGREYEAFASLAQQIGNLNE